MSRRLPDVVEDCEWMARWGETLTGAAQRLGYATRGSLERTLLRANRPDLVAALKAPESDALAEEGMRGRRRRHSLAA